MSPRVKVKALMVGAGHRGREVYGALALAHRERIEFVGVAEPHFERRIAFADALAIPPQDATADWRGLLSRPRFADAVVIAGPDFVHADAACAALEQGYHVLLEKPMALSAHDSVRIAAAADRAQRLVQVAHVLRYTEFYQRIFEVVRSGRLGRVAHIDMREQVAYWHMAHSFVRGKFRNTVEAAPLLLAKCCHDLDLMAWFAQVPAHRVGSFGGLSEFVPANAPAGAPARCTDGCPVQERCAFDAVRFYLGPPAESARASAAEERLALAWPRSDLCLEPARPARRKALEVGPYGRCVYRCDNDVLDHQVVIVEFEGGLTGSFTVQGHATKESRTVRISGSGGEVRGILEEGIVEITEHGSSAYERHDLKLPDHGHFGGDEGLFEHFLQAMEEGANPHVLTSARAAMESHLIGFGAERARHSGQLVDLQQLRTELEQVIRGGELRPLSAGAGR
jgi:predicted dehydrogenase